jgi:hypothetical protein
MNQLKIPKETDGKIFVSRKQFKKVVMPNVGDILVEQFKVEYVNYGKLKFSMSYKTFPPKRGEILKIKDRLFEIDYFDASKKRVGATFKGFDEPTKPIPDAPDVDIEDTVKLI